MTPEIQHQPRERMQGGLVLVLAFGLGMALAAVHVSLAPVIAANRLNETLARIPALLAAGRPSSNERTPAPPLEIQPRDIRVAQKSKTAYYKVYRAVRDDKTVGWVAKAAGQGYADKIEVLVGLNPPLTAITGLFVLDQKETPGLGNKIVSENWRSQFVGKSTARPLKVVKGNALETHTIDAISGATISSRSVTRIVNRVARDLKGSLKQ